MKSSSGNFTCKINDSQHISYRFNGPDYKYVHELTHPQPRVNHTSHKFTTRVAPSPATSATTSHPAAAARPGAAPPASPAGAASARSPARPRSALPDHRPPPVAWRASRRECEIRRELGRSSPGRRCSATARRPARQRVKPGRCPCPSPPLVSWSDRPNALLTALLIWLLWFVALDLERGTRSPAASRSMVSDPAPAEFGRFRI